MSTWKFSVGACGLWALAGCAGAGSGEPSAPPASLGSELEFYPASGGAAAAPAALGEAALGATWQELAVPGASNSPDLAGTPSGWLALSQRSVGDARAPSAWESYLYRSSDGIRWQRVAISTQNQNLWLRGVAYGGGRYVLAGHRFGQGGGGVIFTSSDGQSWDEIQVGVADPSGLADVIYTGGRFFALGTSRAAFTSLDGRAWSSLALAGTVMPLDVAFGDGQYLLVGSGALQRSADGLAWQPLSLDCALPGACISDPSGNVLESVHYRALFAGGSYFIDQASSADGQSWQALPGLYPEAQIEGYVVGSSSDERLVAWQPGQAPQALANRRYAEALADAAELTDTERAERMHWNGAVDPSEVFAENFPNGATLPETLEYPLPEAGDCTSARCVIVGERFYRVAPP